jgi:hypothetical protein
MESDGHVANEISVCNVLGLTLASQAVNKARNYADEHPGIWEWTVGVLFLGTPHGGTKAMHTQSEFVQRIIRAQIDVEDRILQPLKEGNEMLVDVVRKFTKFVRTKQPQPRIFCFYEQKATVLARILGEDGEKVSMNRPSIQFCIFF